MDEFAKMDGATGINLEDVINQAVTHATGEGFDLEEEIGKLIEALQDAAEPTELDGFEPFSFQVGERYYYPIAGTIRKLPTGWVIFRDGSGYTEGDSWITVQHSAIAAVRWVPKPDSEAVEAAIREAA